MGTHVTVVLLVLSPTGRLFFSEAAEPARPATPHPGLRGWLETRFHRFSHGISESQGVAARWCRAVWGWLQRRTHPDEVLLSRLRSAEAIEVKYPASMPLDSAERDWAAFLTTARRRHWPWFVLNAVVSPLTVLLAPLPGPNLIGYWIAYRAVHHLLILIGIRKVRDGRVALTFLPVEGLDPAADLDDAGARLAALGCDPKCVREFVERRGPGPRTRGVTGAA